MADDAEKIAMIIETQAQLAGLRQASSGLSDLEAASLKAGNTARVSAEQSAAAWAKADGSVHEYNLEINRLVDAQKAASAASTGATQATNATADAVGNRLNPNLRSAALGASRLTLAFDGMGGGVAGVARSVGMLSYGIADLSGPGLAALASGVAAAAIVLATLGDLLYKDSQRAEALSDVFKSHLGNMKFDATNAALDDVHKKIGTLESQIPTLSEKLKALAEYGPQVFSNPNDSFLTNLRHELTLTTDAEDQFSRALKENEALGTQNTQQVNAIKDAVQELNTALASDVRNTAFRSQELQLQIQGNTFASQRVALVQQESNAVEEINKKYADQAKLRGGPLTANEIASQQIEIANAQQLLSLGLKLNDVQKARADAQKAQALADATAKVRAAGAGATSDIDGPSATYNKRLIDIDKEYEDATVKQHVDATTAMETRDAERLRAYRDFTNAMIKEDERREQATAHINEMRIQANSDLDKPSARLGVALAKADADAAKEEAANAADTDAAEATRIARKERAWRDYYADVEKLRRENDDAIADSNSDLDPAAAEAAAKLAIWREYYDNLGKFGVSFADAQTRRDAALARLDRDVFAASIQHLNQSAAAAANYGGVVGKIAEATGEAIRRGELAWNAYKDFGKAKSYAAEAIADAASGNFVGAALHGAASVAMFAAAGFEAAGALGAGSGGGGASGGGYSGGQSSTFTPNDQNQSGGQTIIFQQVGAFDQSVMSAVAFELKKQDVLKVPLLIPPSFSPITRAA